MRRENTSRTNAAYTPTGKRPNVGDIRHPKAVRCWSVKRRATRSPGRSENGPGIVVLGALRREILRSPSRSMSRSTVHLATGWASLRSCAWTFWVP